MKRKKYKKAYMALAVIFILCLAAGCAAGGSQPVITSDDLTPFFTVASTENGQGGEAQTAVSTPEPEKDYACVWQTGDIETFNPILSPQEAANRSGRMFEEMYGFDLSGKTLELSCGQIAGTISEKGERIQRTAWDVLVCEYGASDTAEDDVMAFCRVDATTGTILELRYFQSAAEFQAMRQTPAAACYSPETLHWNENSSAYAPTISEMMETAQGILSGSALTEGAAITDAYAELKEFQDESRSFNELHLVFTCENGRKYYLYLEPLRDCYTQYGFEGFPMRGYNFWEENHWLAMNA